MPKHLFLEIDFLKRQLLSLCTLVEESVQRAVKAIESRDQDLAHDVIDNDAVIDKMEITVEEECLKILALHQPVAADLRYIIGVLKINNDLERIGDLAVNIAERARNIAVLPKPDVDLDFPKMEEKALLMLKHSLDAMVNQDSKLALAVCAADDEVDAMNRDMYFKIKSAISTQPHHMDALIHLLSVSRHLERIADHATNIAEDVVYMMEAEIIRHKTEDFRKNQQS